MGVSTLSLLMEDVTVLITELEVDDYGLIDPDKATVSLLRCRLD